MNIHIRDARQDDIQPILHIVNQAILHTNAIYDEEPRTLVQQQQWFEQRAAEQMPVLVATDGQQLAGFGSYAIFRPKAAYRYSVEHSIYLAEGYQGKGIGSQLMQALIERARQQKLHTMIAGIDASNQGSYAFHQKHGFQETGRIREVGYKFGQWLDLIFMQLLL